MANSESKHSHLKRNVHLNKNLKECNSETSSEKKQFLEKMRKDISRWETEVMMSCWNGRVLAEMYGVSCTFLSLVGDWKLTRYKLNKKIKNKKFESRNCSR